jgi:hypothetical protein
MGSVVRRSVAFETEDINEVDALRKKKGLGNKGFSAAVRMIIREWAELTRFSITEKGKQALAEAQDQPTPSTEP